jgi:SAM-dependent methyltransferase
MRYMYRDGDRRVKRFAPAAARNREPILAIARRVLPAQGLVLEVASGSGEHIVHFAEALPGLTWQPSDPDPEARDSIAAWSHELRLGNIREPLELDAASDVWPISSADAVVCINMIHIAPFAACAGLMRGASRILPPGGTLITYGPYKVDGAHTAPSNAAFDESLRLRNSAWGVRDVAVVVACAAEHGITLAERIAMPANNFTLVWRKA